MRRDEAIRIIRQNWAALQAMGVTSLSLFGSVARDEASLQSDVDLLVEFDGRSMGLFAFLDVKHKLEDLFGRKVDLVMRDSIKPQLRNRILGEAVHAA